MRFLLDENVRAEVGVRLQTIGHDVRLTPCGLPDTDVIALARREGRVLITHDAEFANILRYPPGTHAGVIRLRFHPPTLDVMLRALESLLRHVPPSDFAQRLFVLEQDGFRTRA